LPAALGEEGNPTERIDLVITQLRSRIPPRLCPRQVDDTAGDVGVLVEVIAGTDAVVAVGDGQGNAGVEATTNQEHR